MSIRLSSSLLLLFARLCVGQNTLTVAAASDLTALEPVLQAEFEKTNLNIRLRFVNGASAMLSQQIENGAPFDVFLSANAQYVDNLAKRGKLAPDSVRSYATGRLGILWRDKKQHPINELREERVRFLALPNPKLAPYGLAAEEALRRAGIWEAVKPKVVYGENVRQTLQMFESGNADAVITSDSLLQGRGAELIPADWHGAIVQKAGVVTGSERAVAARRFLDWLLGADGQRILAAYGFGKPGER